MQQFAVSQEQFRYLKDRADTTPAKALDKPMRNVIAAINQHPRLATVWSCSGHPDESESGYLMIAIPPEGLEVIGEVFQHIQQTSMESLFTPDLSCGVEYLRWAFHEEDVDGVEVKALSLYPTFSIRWDGRSAYTIEYCVSLIHEAVEQLTEVA